MITRLKVKGFKNLRNIDIELGPFNCIAGVNAVGKSNLFDAIKFLGKLATEKLSDAAKAVRSEGQKASELKDIFFKANNVQYENVYFEVDLIIPRSAEDDLGEMADASITTVKYTLELRLEVDKEVDYIGIVREELAPISQQDAIRSLKYVKHRDWYKSVIHGRRSGKTPFISTDHNREQIVIRLHQDKIKGRPFERNPEKMGRTVLSTVSAEYPTAFLVKEEFKAWTLLQLEPSALRMSDDLELIRGAKLLEDGAMMPATLYRLSKEMTGRDIYQEISNRLSELADDVKEIRVDKDEKRQLLNLVLTAKDASEIPARSLSDGTLRFLALAILESDPNTGGVICLEEPENGIHPRKIKDIIQLLEDIAFDPTCPLGEDNPTRQVIINTHSPLVVQQVSEDSLLVAESENVSDSLSGKLVKQTVFRHLPNTWRDQSNATESISGIGKLLSYLGESESPTAFVENILQQKNRNIKRVIDRDDVQDVFQKSLF